MIMAEISFGGSNAPICHGAGLAHPTLSDLVAAIEFVNAKGEIQVVDDPRLLKVRQRGWGWGWDVAGRGARGKWHRGCWLGGAGVAQGWDACGLCESVYVCVWGGGAGAEEMHPRPPR